MAFPVFLFQETWSLTQLTRTERTDGICLKEREGKWWKQLRARKGREEDDDWLERCSRRVSLLTHYNLTRCEWVNGREWKLQTFTSSLPISLFLSQLRQQQENQKNEKELSCLISPSAHFRSCPDDYHRAISIRNWPAERRREEKNDGRKKKRRK